MKKLLTLFAAGLAVFTGNAQTSKGPVATDARIKIMNGVLTQSPVQQSGVTAAKGTATPIPAWMNYAESQYLETVSALGTYVTAPDSNLMTTSGVYVGYFGWGFSFDPTSKGFTTDALNPNVGQNFVVTSSNAYTVDSVEVLGYYNRNMPSVVDTLYLEVVNSSTPQTYQLQFSGAPENSTDSIARFNTALYDPIGNKMSDSVTSKQTIKKVLNAAAFADSTFFSNEIGYIHRFRFKLPTAISATAGQKIVVYSHFRSGVAQPLGTSFEAANMWYTLANEPLGAGSEVFQKNRETTTGLVITKQTRYTPSTASFQGHHFIYPTIGYAAAAGFDYPFFGFKVTCTTCATTSVANVNNTMSIGDAFPNPSINTVTLPISMKQAANVKVAMTNLVGQTMAVQNLGQVAAGQKAEATFSTAGIANGVYFLTVEANGARTAARFVVAH